MPEIESQPPNRPQNLLPRPGSRHINGSQEHPTLSTLTVVVDHDDHRRRILHGGGKNDFPDTCNAMNPPSESLQALHREFTEIALKSQADVENLMERLSVHERQKATAEKRALSLLRQLNSNVEDLLHQTRSAYSQMDQVQTLKRLIQDLVLAMQDVSCTSEESGASQRETEFNSAISVMVRHAEALRKAHENTQSELEQTRHRLEEQRNLTAKYESMATELSSQLANHEAAGVVLEESLSPLKADSGIMRFQKAAVIATRGTRITRTLQELANSVTSAAKLPLKEGEFFGSDSQDGASSSFCEGHSHLGESEKECHSDTCAAVEGTAEHCSCSTTILKESLSARRYRESMRILLRIGERQGHKWWNKSKHYFHHNEKEILRWVGGVSALFLSLLVLLLAMVTCRYSPAAS